MNEPQLLEQEAPARIAKEKRRRVPAWLRQLALLAALTTAALLVHGYHYGIEDESIYLPAIKVHLDPSLYPHDAAFFAAQARPMLFDELVAAVAELSGEPVARVDFACYLLCLAALLAAMQTLVARLLPERRAQLGGLLLATSLLTLPVAGTCLFLADQHLHPRTLATAFILLAVARLSPRAAGQRIARRDWAWAALAMAGAVLIHVQMAFYGTLYLAALVMPWRPGAWRGLASIAMLPLLPTRWLAACGQEWQEAARTRTQHYLLRWEWYEWLGAVAPIFLLWALGRWCERRGWPLAAAVARRTAIFAGLGLLLGCVMTIPPQFERLTPFQPMRILHLTYIVMILLAGAWMAETLLKSHLRRWPLLFVPLAGVMAWAQYASFPASSHIEWPGHSAGNDWVQAFEWVSRNTPPDAYFVLDPHYMDREGEDFHSFRALAERSQMADWNKDPGVVLLFPETARRWAWEVHGLDGWEHFTAADLHRLHERYGITWTLLPLAPSGDSRMIRAAMPPLQLPASDCPYHNRSVVVCRVK